MGGPEAFTGPVVVDLIAWGVGGQLFGGILGFLATESFNRLVATTRPADVGSVAGRAAWAGATFGVSVAAAGHVMRPFL